MFKAAGTSEIIRSHQKDDNNRHSLRSAAADAVQSLLDLQTVGEEYVNMIQTDHTLRQLPSKWRRGVMVALQVCAPYILQSALHKFEHQLQVSGSLPIKPSTRKVLLDVIPLFRKAVSLVHRLHLAKFYIQGLFYHISKRITGIHYIQISSEASKQNQPFRILGYLSLFQISLSILIHVYQIVLAMRKNHLQPDQLQYQQGMAADDQLTVLPKDKCPLCLEKRVNTTLTPCGHLYCWNCILEWCQAKQECPLCRDQFSPQRLIILQNYDSS